MGTPLKLRCTVMVLKLVMKSGEFDLTDRQPDKNSLAEGSTNLWAGTGNPWAGQVKLKEIVEGFSTVELLSPRLNIGADPPIGSE